MDYFTKCLKKLFKFHNYDRRRDLLPITLPIFNEGYGTHLELIEIRMPLADVDEIEDDASEF
jgi:hypothetical protein